MEYPVLSMSLVDHSSRWQWIQGSAGCSLRWSWDHCSSHPWGHLAFPEVAWCLWRLLCNSRGRLGLLPWRSLTGACFGGGQIGLTLVAWACSCGCSWLTTALTKVAHLGLVMQRFLGCYFQVYSMCICDSIHGRCKLKKTWNKISTFKKQEEFLEFRKHYKPQRSKYTLDRWKFYCLNEEVRQHFKWEIIVMNWYILVIWQYTHNFDPIIIDKYSLGSNLKYVRRFFYGKKKAFCIVQLNRFICQDKNEV